MHGMVPKIRCRTIWISDTHLGTRGCRAEELLQFLQATDCDRLYLVGDIVDGWRLKRAWYWPQSHERVVRAILDKARSGTRVTYVPGNHDEALRSYIGTHFAGVEVVEEAVHETADGRRLLVLHGDGYDNVIRYAPWLARLGDAGYQLAIAINRRFNAVRRALGLPYWSLSGYLKFKVKDAVKFINDFEATVAAEARRRGLDGVICGHIHHASLRVIDDTIYGNDGDWVESCTALTEDHHDGNLAIRSWPPAIVSAVPVRAAQTVAACA